MSLYTLNRLSKVFAGREVLNIPELTIEKGRIYALVGANGAGKTTLLTLLSFLDIPSTGDIFFDSHRVNYEQKRHEKLRRTVIMLDQYPILFSTTVYKNLEFGLKIRKVNKVERQRRITEALDEVGMKDFIDYPAANLSGGESQRVALARVLVLQPEVLLCDEPISNVDRANQVIIADLLRDLNSKKKMSIIFSTHDHNLASTLAYRTIDLDHRTGLGSGDSWYPEI